MQNDIRVCLPLVAFLAATLYVPNLMSPSVVPGLALLSFAIPVMFIGQVRPFVSHLQRVMLLLLLWAAFTVSWALKLDEALVGLWWLILFCGCIQTSMTLSRTREA